MANYALPTPANNRIGKVDKAFSVTLPHQVLLILIAVCFAGIVPLIGEISRVILYAFYVVCFVCAGLTYLEREKTPIVLGAFGLYAYWLALYFVYGSLISVDQLAVIPDAMRAIAKVVMLFCMLISGLRRKQDIVLIARNMAVVMIIGAAVSLWMSTNPGAIIAFNSFFGADDLGFDQIRPAGLWINPNEASFAALFYLVLSRWTRGRLIVIAQIAAVIIIIWSASRTGLYVLVICTIVYGIGNIGNTRINKIILGLLYSLLAVIVMVSIASILPQSTVRTIGEALGAQSIWEFRIERILDFSETEGARSGVRTISRRDLIRYSMDAIREGPALGYGVTAFQDAHENSVSLSILPTGAHNIFITVLGEVGLIGFMLYIAVFVISMLRLARSHVAANDKFLVRLLVFMFCLIGLTWHNQLSDFLGILMSGLMFLIPEALAQSANEQQQ